MAEVIDILSLVPHSLNLRSNHLWLDYDDEADVLYISLRKPQRATDSEMKGRFIYHYDGNELVGVTVLHARSSSEADAAKAFARHSLPCGFPSAHFQHLRKGFHRRISLNRQRLWRYALAIRWCVRRTTHGTSGSYEYRPKHS